MLKLYYKAFTLVELIVVIVILSILATISFLSFSSYSSSSRDSVRLGDITNIAKGLTLQYSIGGSYIIPDNSVSLLSGSTTIIGYQGKAGYNTLNSIKLSTSNNNSGKDPLDNTYYTYNINSNKNKYQLSGFLENKGNIINRTSSINNSNIENNNFELLSFGAEGNGVEGIYENNSVIPVNTGIFHLLSNNYFSAFFNIKDLPAGRQVPVSSTRMTNNGIVFDNNSIPHLTSPRTGEELSSLPLTKGELEGVFQINQVNATTYTNRYPYTKGDGIGVILSSIGGTGSIVYTPLEDSGTGIDISSGTLTSGKIVINNNTDSSTGVSVVSMSGYVTGGGGSSSTTSTDGTSSSTPGNSCLSIKTSYPSSTDGVYRIKPDSNPAFQVDCDMTIDGGGWTIAIGAFSASAFSCGIPQYSISANYVNCNLKNTSATSIKEVLYNGATLASANTLTTTSFNISDGYINQATMVFGISGTQKSLGTNGAGVVESYASIDGTNYFAYSTYYNNHFTGWGAQIYGTDTTGGGNINSWSLSSYAGITHNKVFILIR